jgi:citrate lyase subunit beta/citryl-CoA lyase
MSPYWRHRPRTLGREPPESELQWARAVLAVADSATAVDGQMVDKPVVEPARRIIAAGG